MKLSFINGMKVFEDRPELQRPGAWKNRAIPFKYYPDHFLGLAESYYVVDDLSRINQPRSPKYRKPC